MLSLFFHVIMVPADTVIVPGENAIPAMVTVFGELLDILLLLLLEHDKNMTKDSKTMLIIVVILFFIFGILSVIKNDCVFTKRRKTRKGCLMNIKNCKILELTV